MAAKPAATAAGGGAAAAAAEAAHKHKQDDSSKATTTTTTTMAPMARSCIPYACLYIDATWRDLAAAYGATLTSADRTRLQADMARAWGGGNVLTTLSVRTALDLYLQVHAFPRGSHVLMTAINIPDMSVVLRHHGLVPVPVDVDPHTFLPDFAIAERLVTRKTVALCAAHVFGRRMPMDPVVAFARRHKLLVLEDCAEAMSGLGYSGDPRADLALVSFGSIKVGTAFGGAMARVRDTSVYERMAALQATFQPQSRWMWFKKVVKNTPVMGILNVPLFTAAVQNTAYWLGVDHKAIVVSLLRGFPDKLMERLRAQPSTPLLAFLHRRLTHFDAAGFQRNTDKGHYMSAALGHPVAPTSPSTSATANATRALAATAATRDGGPAPLMVPGAHGAAAHYWLYPIVVAEPAKVIAELSRLGVDAYRGATQLALVPPPPEWGAILAEAKHYRDDAAAAAAAAAAGASTAAAAGAGAGAAGDGTTAGATGADAAAATDADADASLRRDLLPVDAQYVMDHIVYLPVHKHVPDAELQRMARVVRHVLARLSPHPPQLPVPVRSRL